MTYMAIRIILPLYITLLLLFYECFWQHITVNIFGGGFKEGGGGSHLSYKIVEVE